MGEKLKVKSGHRPYVTEWIIVCQPLQLEKVT